MSMITTEMILEAFEEFQLPYPSKIKFACEDGEAESLAKKFTKLYSKNCKQFIDELNECAEGDYEFDMLPNSKPSIDICDSIVTVDFGDNIFSIDGGENLPDSDDFADFGSVLEDVLDELAELYDFEINGFFGWTYNNGVDYVNDYIELDCDMNSEFVLEIMKQTLLDEDLWDEFLDMNGIEE